jgi:hypothetical protein
MAAGGEGCLCCLQIENRRLDIGNAKGRQPLAMRPWLGVPRRKMSGSSFVVRQQANGVGRRSASAVNGLWVCESTI